MDKTGREQTSAQLHFVEDLPLEVGGPIDISQPTPGIVVRKQSREWFWCRRVLRFRLEKLPDGREEIGVELQYHEGLQIGSSSEFPAHPDAKPNPEAR
jgi:hypothetical protein